MECLDDNDVTDFVSGSLGQSATTKVEAHLAGCRDCRALVAAMAADVMADSNVQTVRHEKLSASQVTYLPKRTLTVGDKVGRYLILSTLGTGGMGIVFAAYDPQLDRKVALKLLRTGLQLPTKDAQKRLRREAQAIAQLSHPNVVQVYDVGMTDDDELYIAMEFVEGDTLSQWLKAYPRSWREIVDVFTQAGKGLVAAHGSGLLHRDFKPDNVLVGGDGRVRVTDFGLARSILALEEESGKGDASQLAGISASLTATGTVLGTPRYMPPEQLRGPDIDARADQFSFAVALYEALYGQHPLPGGTSVSMLEQGEKAIPAPEGSKIPTTIVRAVARGLERDRTKRYPTMALLMSDLVPPQPRQPMRWIAAAVAAVAVVGVATAYALRPPARPVETTLEQDTRADLIKKINQLNREKNEILEELHRAQQISLQQKKELATKLDAADQEIKQLQDQLIDIPTRPKEPPKPAVTPAQVALDARSRDALAVLNSVSFAGCFQEWGERPDDNGHARTAATLQVAMTVDELGAVKGASVTGDSSESLRICMRDAVARAQYPKGDELLDLVATVDWKPDSLQRSSRIAARRPVPKLDL
ncbi:MAG TPA: protein kinase [Kofleriaceae bacterium]|jgi:serine/threonine protein kinase